MLYGLVIPCYIMNCALIGWYSIAAGGHNFTDKLILAAINCLPIWLLVSRFSRHQMFDTILINIAGSTAYLATVLFFDERLRLAPINGLGLALAGIGIVLMKIPSKHSA